MKNKYSIKLLKLNLKYHTERVKELKEILRRKIIPIKFLQKSQTDLDFHLYIIEDIKNAIQKLNTK